MNLMWAIYWIDVLGKLKTFLSLSIFVLALVGALCPMLLDFEWPKVFKFWSRILLVGAIFAAGAISIPSEKTMYAMLAANVGQKVVEDPKFQEIGGKALKILNDKLDELAGEKEGGGK